MAGLARRPRSEWTKRQRGPTVEQYDEWTTASPRTTSGKKRCSGYHIQFSNCWVSYKAIHFHPKNSPNYRSFQAQERLAIFLYFLTESGLKLWDPDFRTASRTTHLVFEAISSNWGPKYLRLPKNQDEMRNKMQNLKHSFGMRQACRCNDGTHIPILRPTRLLLL